MSDAVDPPKNETPDVKDLPTNNDLSAVVAMGTKDNAVEETSKDNTDPGTLQEDVQVPASDIDASNVGGIQTPTPVSNSEDNVGVTLSTQTLSMEASYKKQIAKAKDDAIAARKEAAEARALQRAAEDALAQMQEEANGVQEAINEFEVLAQQQDLLINIEIDKAKTEWERKLAAVKGDAAEWQALAVAEAAKTKAAEDAARKEAHAEIEGLKRELKEAREILGAAEGTRKFASDTKDGENLPTGTGSAGITPSSPTNASNGDLPELHSVPYPEPSYLCRSIFPTTDDASSNNPAIFSPKRLWPNGYVITYRFVDGHINQHTKVTKVIPEWSRYANITFKLVYSDALLVISFKNYWECWSHIGTDARTTTANPPYTMALGPVSKESPNVTRGDRALILHQFGHALGLVHEHMCPSQTNGLSINQNATFEHPSFRNLGSVIGKHFSVYADSSVTNYASPDLSSIMIFSMPGELNEGNFTIEPNVTLSPLDKAFMVINYPRARVHSQASEWTLRHALLIANVDEHTARVITEEHDLVKRRTLFANFFAAARQQDLTHFVDPAPEIVGNFSLLPVQSALQAFFTDLEKHSKAKEILADSELREELIVVLDRLTTHRAIREVVQRGKAGHTDHQTSDVTGAKPTFVSSLLNVALMLHGATHPQVPSSNHDEKSLESEGIDVATALYTQLARHATFQAAMKRTVGDKAPSTEALLNVNSLVARLVAHPAVLRAVRHALCSHV